MGIGGFGDFVFWGLGLDNNVLAENGGLLQVLLLTVHLKFFLTDKWGDHSETFLLYELFCGAPPSCLKVIAWVVVGGLQDFSISPSPLWVNLGF